MKRPYALGALALTAPLAILASPALAATVFTPGSQVIDVSSGSALFGATMDQTGTFSHTFTFTTSQSKYGYIHVANTSISGTVGNIDFSSITVGGQPLSQSVNGTTETWTLSSSVPVAPGTYQILLNGMSYGTSSVSASYSGVLVFTDAEVPEPATWGLMLAGFTAVGAVVRRRRRPETVLA